MRIKNKWWKDKKGKGLVDYFEKGHKYTVWREGDTIVSHDQIHDNKSLLKKIKEYL